jgi:predicted nucleotide-binding protein
VEPLSPFSDTVFVVHGHDTATICEVVRTVFKITNKEATILHEQLNQCQTIIEKFERHASDAGFVIVLATADDVGRAKSAKDSISRARQNVVFELGYFIGALGRSRVVVLHDEDVELPSNMSEVLYIPMDDHGAWKLDLAKEMRAASLVIDTTDI